MCGGEKMVNVSKAGEVYKCDICGNVVVVREVGGGELVCCGEPMQLMEGE
jgi:desulfoferrodoxin-like iron-binding protein